MIYFVKDYGPGRYQSSRGVGFGSKSSGENKPNFGNQSMIYSTGSSGGSFIRSKPGGLSAYATLFENARGRSTAASVQ